MLHTPDRRSMARIGCRGLVNILVITDCFCYCGLAEHLKNKAQTGMEFKRNREMPRYGLRMGTINMQREDWSLH